MKENKYLSHSVIVYLVKFDESYQTNFANQCDCHCTLKGLPHLWNKDRKFTNKILRRLNPYVVIMIAMKWTF